MNEKGLAACTLCGLCDAADDGAVAKDERRAPRGIIRALLDGETTPYVYGLLLNGKSSAVCPVRIDIDAAAMAARAALVARGVETAANKRFMERLKKEENPFR